MSTNELIAEANRLLAENQWTSGWGVEPLADQLVTALEAVTAERDELLNAEELAAEDRGRLIEERNELAAFREAVQGADNEYAHDEDGYSYFRHDVQDALKAAPEVALDHVKAEALRDAADLAGSIDGGYEVELWLTERADRIEKGVGNDQ